MSSTRLSILMATALLGGAVTAALAQDVAVTETTTEAKTFGGKVVTISVGGVYAVSNASGSLGDADDSGGYDLRVGYGVHEMATIEMEWQSIVNMERSAVDPVTLNPEPDVEARMLSLNGRFSPLTCRFQPYALMGMGWVNVQADQTGVNVHKSSFGMRFGAGLATFVTDRIGFTLEAAYILPLTGTLGGGDHFGLVPITGSVFVTFN